MKVWDLATEQGVAPIGRLLRHLFATLFRRTARDISVSAVGHRAVSSGSDGTIRIWDLDTGKQLHALTGHGDSVRAVAVSADGQRAVSCGDDGTVRIWDLDTGEEYARFTSENRATCLAVTLSATGVIVGTSIGTVHLLELCGCG